MRLFARPLISILSLTIMLLTACSGVIGTFPSEDAPKTVENPTEGYLLEPGNRVRITVFNEQNLSGDFTVDPVGNIALPLVGNVPASGVTAKVLAHRIEDAMKKGGYLQEPSVAAEVQTFRPFYVLGEVRQAGEFQYSTGMTVLSAIARAGGYSYRAVTDNVVLVRMVDGKQVEYRATEQAPILPGDIVKVLERRF